MGVYECEAGDIIELAGGPAAILWRELGEGAIVDGGLACWLYVPESYFNHLLANPLWTITNPTYTVTLDHKNVASANQKHKETKR